MTNVTIIMPCYNSAQFIDEAVCSVVNQSFQDWELLICDDESTDGSQQIAEDWARKDPRIKVLKNEFEQGAAGARNTCLSEAQGRYIAFLDADDLWLPQKLESQLRFMSEKNAPFVFGYCENMSEEGDRLSVTKAPERVSFTKILLSNFIPCLTVIYDSKMLGKVYQPNIKKRNDFALWLRILGEYRDVKALCYPEIIARYRVNSYGLSANKLSGIKYFYLCLRQFAGIGPLQSVCLTFAAVAFKTLKTLHPKLYNFIVSRL